MKLPPLTPSEWALSVTFAGVVLWVIAALLVVVVRNAFGYRAPQPGHLPLAGFVWLGLGTTMIVGGLVAFVALVFLDAVW